MAEERIPGVEDKGRTTGQGKSKHPELLLRAKQYIQTFNTNATNDSPTDTAGAKTTKKSNWPKPIGRADYKG